MKLCKDCKWYRRSLFERMFMPKRLGERCVQPAVASRYDVMFCGIERDPAHDLVSPCGSAGKLWEFANRRHWWQFWRAL